MSKPTPFQQRNVQAFMNPETARAYTMQRYGMEPADVEHALRLNMALVRGRMPDNEQIKWAAESARQKFGWTAERTRSELRQILEQPTAEGRIFGYLKACGHDNITEGAVREVMGLVENAARADMENSLMDRVESNADLAYMDKKPVGMEATPRVKDAADDRLNLRHTLKALAGDSAPTTYEEARQRVHRAGLRLADRIEADQARDMMDIANGREPREKSLREELGMAYDVEKVASAREAYGFGDIKGDAAEVVSHTSHMDDHADITEDIRDL